MTGPGGPDQGLEGRNGVDDGVPGMGQGLLATNPVVVAAFRAALRAQGLLVFLLILAVVAAAAMARIRSASPLPPVSAPAGSGLMLQAREPAARRLLRLGFGLLWVLDGLLQAQPAMPLGLPTQVVRPAAATSPPGVQHLVDAGLSIWTRHPVIAAASVVWIQVGIGVFLLVARDGVWSRLAGAASAAWGLVVWAFGEAFGGVLGHGASWLFGTPGAALFYVVAGALVALPRSEWNRPDRRAGRLLMAVSGVFLLAMAALQAWPGRGFWQGQRGPHAATGTLTSMVQDMASTQQPRVIAAVVRWFSVLDAAHGWAVNAVTVIVLALAGIGLVVLSVRWDTRVAVATLAVTGALCVSVWVLVQDLGVFGGVGTDPNSMVPFLLLVVAGYASTRPSGLYPNRDAAAGTVIGRPVEHQADPGPGDPVHAGSPRWLTGVAAAAACGIVAVGAVPMAWASTDPRTDPILTEAVNGDVGAAHRPAPDFALVDQNNRPVSLSGLRGRTVVLTFLDPVCTTDCPLIAQELRLADGMLGARAAHTTFVAVVGNPVYRSAAVLRAFDQQEHLTGMRNWLFLTGPADTLRTVWADYGYQAQTLPAGAMVAHSDLILIIDASGTIRRRLGADPGDGGPTAASLATQVSDQVNAVTGS